MAASKAWTLTVNEGVAELLLDCPKESINKLSSAVMDEFQDILEDLKTRDGIDVCVIKSAKENIFIAGADIAEIKDLTEPAAALSKARMGQDVFTMLENLPFPTIAAIRGACLGGGLELALACRYRVASDHPKTFLGLPEVTLGIIPGFGGTQRLPRLVGLEEGLKLILKGKFVAPREAYRNKLVDMYYADEFWDERLASFIERVRHPKQVKRLQANRNARPLRRKIIEDIAWVRTLVIKKSRQMILKQTKGHYPAPLVALDVIEQTWGDPLQEGMRKEAEAFSVLPGDPVCQNLIGLFYAREELKKNPGARTTSELTDVEHAAVLGAGVMGGGISWLFSLKDITVLMKDVSWDAVGIGYRSAMAMYKKLVQLRKLRQSQVNVNMHKITGTVDYAGFADVDIAVEAIVEDMDVKKAVLAEMEQELSKEAIMVTNTSALSVTEMARSLKKATRFCGMHFFNPVNRMPLVEVIPGEKTNNATIASVVALCKRLGKTPIVVQDCPGFLVNRILIPYVNEAAHLLVEGSGMLSLDQSLKNFGLPMGPFQLADEVGLDVGYKVAHILQEAYGERMKVAPLLPVLYEGHQLLGKKSDKGFYTYSGKNKAINPALRSIVGNYQKTNGLKPQIMSEEDCIDRCILIMVNEAARCMEEEIVDRAAHLDMAMIMGTGFPPFRGGLLRYADRRGIVAVVDRLNDLAERYGTRFEPCDLLKTMALEQGAFYS